MEQRLINANNLYELFEARYKNSYGSAHRTWGIAIDYVCDAPTIESRTVVHGRWVHKTTEDDDWGGTYHKWSCSICEFSVGNNPTGANFCPNCGAKMDGGEENA